MSWFSTLKGNTPSLAQIDKCLPVMVGEEDIVRGTLLVVDDQYNTTAGGVFRMAQAADTTDPQAKVYFALVGQDDSQAGMAGSIGQGVATDEAGVAGAAKITGIPCSMNQEFQTDEFTGEDTVFTTGTPLSCGDDGKLVPAADGDNVVGYVTTAPFNRWVNDAAIANVNRTGAVVKVMNVMSAWVPLATDVLA